MSKGLLARASVTIEADRDAVWNALIDPERIREYMFGTHVDTDWQVGSPITWKGDWKGKPYQDKGTVVRFDRGRLIEYTHFSPLSGEADLPEHYHTVTIELEDEGAGTRVTLTQDNNASDEARRHSTENWETMLAGLKTLVEGRR